MSVPQLGAATAHAARRSSTVFDTAFGELDGRRPGRVPPQVPQDGGLAVRLLPGQRLRCSTPTSAATSPTTAFLDERTSRVWIHGDLHAENFGTYMNAYGQLVFNVNDFDEAYVGPFTWDLQAASPPAWRCSATPRRSPTSDQRPGAPASPGRT